MPSNLTKITLRTQYLSMLLASIGLLDPRSVFWGLDNINQTFKYSPIVISAVALGLIFITFPRAIARSLTWQVVCVIGLFTIELSGGLYTVFTTNGTLQDSFVGRALNILPFFASFITASNPSCAGSFVHVFGRFIVVNGSCCLFIKFLFHSGLAFGDVSQVVHETAVFIVAAALWFQFAKVPSSAKWLFTIVSIFFLAISGKHTQIVWAAIIIAFILMRAFSRFFVSSDKSVRTQLRMLLLLSGGVVIFAGIFVAQAVYLHKEEVASEDIRYLTADIRMENFWGSPTVGSLFVGSPVLYLEDENGRELVVPTHNDYLDALSFGGSMSFALLVLPLLAAVRKFGLAVWGSLRGVVENEYFVSCVFMMLSIINIEANPELQYPPTATFFWSALGLVLGYRHPTWATAGRRKARPHVVS